MSLCNNNMRSENLKRNPKSIYISPNKKYLSLKFNPFTHLQYFKKIGDENFEFYLFQMLPFLKFGGVSLK